MGEWGRELAARVVLGQLPQSIRLGPHQSSSPSWVLTELPPGRLKKVVEVRAGRVAPAASIAERGTEFAEVSTKGELQVQESPVHSRAWRGAWEPLENGKSGAERRD